MTQESETHAGRAAGDPLSLPPVTEIETEVHRATDPGSAEAAAADPELAAMADAFVRQVLEASHDDRHGQRQAVDSMGIEVQRQAAHRSAMLQEPVRRLAAQGEEGSAVARGLGELRQRMETLDPNRHNLRDGAVGRALALLPGVGTRLQRYFRRFESAQDAIDAIIRDLEAGRDMLRRDNLTLADDQQALRENLVQVRRQIELGRLIDARLQQSAEAGDTDDARRAFIEEELLFPLRQRITDLQQQLAVNQQGVLALEVLIRNNRELMRGVDRAINVTVSALTVAVTVALALADQRLVLNRVEALNATTSEMISGTAHTLREQGVAIQNRAGSAVLDMEQLEQAFRDVLGAIDEVGRYRREALPRLQEQIERLDALAAQGDDAIHRLDAGRRADTAEGPDDISGGGGR